MRFINPGLLHTVDHLLAAHVKSAFVPGADPSGGAPPGAGGPPPGAGGPPPGAGGPPPGAGGPPPGGPPPGGPPPGGPPPGGGGGDLAALQPLIDQAVQKAMATGGGAPGAGGVAGAPGLKPKIDTNSEIMKMQNMLARVVDTLGIHIPAQDMVATPDKLTAMAQGQSPGGGGAPAGGAGAISPIGPMQGMQPSGVPGAKTAQLQTNQATAAYLLQNWKTLVK